MYQIKATSNEIVQLVPKSLSELDNKMWNESCHFEKVALVLAHSERVVSHTRLSQFSDQHTKDIGDCLQKLEREGRLTSTGAYRAKTYHLPHQSVPSPEDVFDTPNNEPSSTNLDSSSTNLDSSSTNLDSSSTNLDSKGRIVHDKFTFPFIETLETLQGNFREELQLIAQSAREKKKIPREEMIEIILKLCSDQYITTNALAGLVQRDLQTLRGQYITKLKNEGKIELAFPRTPNNPRQAYLTSK